MVYFISFSFPASQYIPLSVCDSLTLPLVCTTPTHASGRLHAATVLHRTGRSFRHRSSNSSAVERHCRISLFSIPPAPRLYRTPRRLHHKPCCRCEPPGQNGEGEDQDQGDRLFLTLTRLGCS